MKNIKFYIFTFLLIFFLSTKQKSHAHPHVFIEYWTDVIFKNGKLAGLQVHWLFDEFFSAMIIRANDTNRNKRFEPREVKVLKKRAFDNLRNYKYFSYLKLNGIHKFTRWVTIFNAKITRNRLIYSFYIPLNVSIKSTTQKLRIEYLDPTVYVAFAPRKNPIIIKKMTNVRTTLRRKHQIHWVNFRR